MTTLLFLGIIFCLGLGYRFYGSFISRVLGIDKDKETPAHTCYDGVDYIPAKNSLVLFGHHFSSIAGAGPIVGPVVAYMCWGWLGAIFWIVLGSIFMGAVHDFSSLFVSMREEGKTIGEVASIYLSKRVSKTLLIFLWLALIIVIAIFAAICAKSFISEPGVVLPSLGIIPVAVLVGFLLYRFKFNSVVSTLLGLLALAGLIFLGKNFSFKINISHPYQIWLIVLFIYAFLASILPVNILLQPRDYLCSFLLFFGIACAFVGIIIKPLPLEGARVFKLSSSLGGMFPLMFITIACGAISGFHSLVASGTTSKQIAKETDAKKIGYGAMLLEAVLATVALFSVAFGIEKLPFDKSKGVEFFAQGFSNFTFFLGGYANFFALVMVNSFILTTLDTATRITRFLTQEFFGIKNKYFATLLVIGVGAYFTFSNTWFKLWPVFGASNQLVGALALIVVSAYLIKKKKNFFITLIPAFFMTAVTVWALFLKSKDFLFAKNYPLFFITALLIILSLFICLEFFKIFRKNLLPSRSPS